MRSTLGLVEGAIDTLNEGLSIEGLREKTDGPARERPLLDSRIRKAVIKMTGVRRCVDANRLCNSRPSMPGM
jgi:hypothetical protein